MCATYTGLVVFDRPTGATLLPATTSTPDPVVAPGATPPAAITVVVVHRTADPVAADPAEPAEPVSPAPATAAAPDPVPVTEPPPPVTSPPATRAPRPVATTRPS